MRSRTFLLFSLLLLLALPAAARFWYSALSDSDSFRNATETKTFTHVIPSEAKGTHLSVKLRIDTGEAVVTLLDPAGKACYTHAFAKGTHEIDRRSDGNAGKWTVRLELRGASGRYSVKLKGY